MCSQSNNSNEDWEPCPEGLLHEAARGQRNIHRRRLLVGGGLVAAGAISFTALRLSNSLISSQPNFKYGGLDCVTVKSMFQEAQQARLDASKQKQFDTHIAKCINCAASYREYLKRAQA